MTSGADDVEALRIHAPEMKVTGAPSLIQLIPLLGGILENVAA